MATLLLSDMKTATANLLGKFFKLNVSKVKKYPLKTGAGIRASEQDNKLYFEFRKNKKWYETFCHKKSEEFMKNIFFQCIVGIFKPFVCRGSRKWQKD